MNFLANIISFFSISAANQQSRETLLILLDEPECPKELL